MAESAANSFHGVKDSEVFLLELHQLRPFASDSPISWRQTGSSTIVMLRTVKAADSIWCGSFPGVRQKRYENIV